MSATEAQTSTSKLPDALAALARYPQFIVWESRPNPKPNGKPFKVPLNKNLTDGNAHDPANWYPVDEAFAIVDLCNQTVTPIEDGARYGVGFVLTEQDPFFCLDIDHCLLSEDTRSPLALDLLARLPGAAVEVSFSGDGLHVWGATTRRIEHKCRNKQHSIELYTEKRFIALGHPDATGDASTDCTVALSALVANYFPPVTATAKDRKCTTGPVATAQPISDTATAGDQEWTTGPVASAQPIADDAALIERARKAKSAGAVFGDSASFAELWEANAEALSKHYPHATNDYDASRADAALAAHLAFWTGKNCARIAVLMRQSALVRDKWDREDYLPHTILQAVAGLERVYTGVHGREASNVTPAGAQGGVDATTADTVTYSRIFKCKDHAACFAALADMEVDVRANTRKRGRVEVNEAESGWSALTDASIADLRDRIADRYGYHTAHGDKALNFGLDKFNEHLLAASYRNQVDPFKLWLEMLPAWDGTARLDNWITRLFMIAGDPQLAAWVSRYLFLGAIQRTYEPGCKLDQIPVLIGPQNTGKSTVLRASLPPNDEAAGLVDLFSDGLHLAALPKERAESLEGRVLVEVAEMSGATRADLESLKAFLTRTDDGDHRKAYARHAESSPRRCIIAATADNNRVLPNDPAGNRRFVAIEITKSTGAAEAFMAAERDQLWAEAIQRYRKGERANLPRSYATIQAAANETQRADDVLEDRIAGMRYELNGKTPSEIAAELGFGAVKVLRADQMRIATALTQNGFEKRAERRGPGPGVKVWRLKNPAART